MEEFFAMLGGSPTEVFAAIFTLILIESLLSVDNAAVLATMVLNLPKHQRNKALKYGIIGAYAFRGICLAFAAFIIRIWWLKPLGGLYLLWLAYDYFKTKATPSPDDDTLNPSQNWLYRSTLGLLGPFWATVVLVEFMDLAFSIDNVLAAVAINDNLYIVMIGVFIGILAMRFVAQTFVRLMERFPFLETSAFLVIGILGLKLLTALYTHFYPDVPFSRFMESSTAEIALSAVTCCIFFIPMLTSWLFNVPGRRAASGEG
jgi:YkoY family integral membrane protein